MCVKGFPPIENEENRNFVEQHFDGTFAKEKCCLKVAIFVKLQCGDLTIKINVW